MTEARQLFLNKFYVQLYYKYRPTLMSHNILGITRTQKCRKFKDKVRIQKL